LQYARVGIIAESLMKMVVVIAALIGAIIGFAAAGFGAAAALVAVFGDHDGGTSMSGFFGFGPVGGLAGALLGAGLAIYFGGRSKTWGRRLMISAGVLFGLGGLILAIASTPNHTPSYSEVIEFELEYPSSALAGVDIPSSNAMWGAAGADADDHPISQFFEKKCTGDVCLVNGSVAAIGPMNNFRVATMIGQKRYRYTLDLPPVVSEPVDWSAWRPGDGAKVRWRIVRH
jgi:MFS family permease